MVTLEKITLQAQGFNIVAVTRALMKHSDMHRLDDADNTAYAFKLSEGEAVITYPCYSMANAPFAAKVKGTGGKYEIERFAEFPSGQDLSSFEPAKYEKRSRWIALFQRRGWE